MLKNVIRNSQKSSTLKNYVNYLGLFLIQNTNFVFLFCGGFIHYEYSFFAIIIQFILYRMIRIIAVNDYCQGSDVDNFFYLLGETLMAIFLTKFQVFFDIWIGITNFSFVFFLLLMFKVILVLCHSLRINYEYYCIVKQYFFLFSK